MDEGGKVCVRCAKQAPETESNYTLFGPEHGWRVVRHNPTGGAFSVKWYCAECWRERNEVMKPPM